jgi:uncharacterized protein YoxC
MAKTETEKKLTPQEIVNTATEVKRNLPEPPKNIIFKIIRGGLERKIENQGQVADKHKSQIAACNKQSCELQEKINSLCDKLDGYTKSNEYLNGLNGKGFIKSLTIGSNNRNIAKIEKQIAALKQQQEKVQSKCDIVQSKLNMCEKNINNVCDKINRIDEVKDFPKAVLVYFLAETCKSVPEVATPEQAVEVAQEEVTTPEPSTGQESPAQEHDIPPPNEPTINFDEIDIEQDELEFDEHDHAQEHDELEQDEQNEQDETEL